MGTDTCVARRSRQGLSPSKEQTASRRGFQSADAAICCRPAAESRDEADKIGGVPAAHRLWLLSPALLRPWDSISMPGAAHPIPAHALTGTLR